MQRGFKGSYMRNTINTVYKHLEIMEFHASFDNVKWKPSFRSKRQIFFKKDVLKNFANLKKNLCWRLFKINLQVY